LRYININKRSLKLSSTVFPFRFWSSSPHLGTSTEKKLGFSFFSFSFCWPYDSHHRPRSLSTLVVCRIPFCYRLL
jgi:hypothetical protein